MHLSEHALQAGHLRWRGVTLQRHPNLHIHVPDGAGLLAVGAGLLLRGLT